MFSFSLGTLESPTKQSLATFSRCLIFYFFWFCIHSVFLSTLLLLKKKKKLKQNSSSCRWCTSGKEQSTHQVHLVCPLEVVFHRPIVQPNPGVIVTQALGKKINKQKTHYLPLRLIFFSFSKNAVDHFIPRSR